MRATLDRDAWGRAAEVDHHIRGLDEAARVDGYGDVELVRRLLLAGRDSDADRDLDTWLPTASSPTGAIGAKLLTTWDRKQFVSAAPVATGTCAPVAHERISLG